MFYMGIALLLGMSNNQQLTPNPKSQIQNQITARLVLAAWSNLPPCN